MSRLIISKDLITSIEAGLICGINVVWINKWLNVFVAIASIVYLVYKTAIIHKENKKNK